MQTVMWFRRDLRIQDNKALYYACENLKKDDQLVLLFQVNPQQFLENSPNHQAFFSSLQAFKKKLDKKGQLQILYGEPLEAFQRLKEALPDWQKIYFNEDTHGFGQARDREAVAFFHRQEIESYAYQDAYLHGAGEVKKQDGSAYQIFTPYYHQWLEQPKETPLKVAFESVKIHRENLFPQDEKKLQQLFGKLPDLQLAFGEAAGQERLQDFITEDLAVYKKARDIPSRNQTSQLSRFLRTGELSIRNVWQQLQQTKKSEARTTFEKELCWRDFYNMIYTQYPQQKKQAIQSNFQYVEWENDPEKFKAWQAGKTGFPIVDAAMRQLKTTGWMHNRLRMITASFLTKDLLIDWRWGEKYFQQMLIDYDPASNIGGWQWAASTGTDAAPYFRIFNPTTQSKKFDASGAFIREYVNELAKLPEKLIHQPELMTPEQQEQYAVHLGEEYPHPLVQHQEQRKKALARYEASKEYAQETQGSEDD